MEKITSKNNPLIVETAKLKAAKHRKLNKSFLIEGLKVIEMAFEAGAQVDKILCLEKNLENYSSLLSMAEKAGVKVFAVSDSVSKKLSSGKSTQGIFAVVKPNDYGLDFLEGSLVIALEDLSDPGNVGTIIRTADACGVKSILISIDSADIYNDKTIRASMGSVFNVKCVKSDDLIKDLAQLKTMGYSLACGHLNGTDFFERETVSKTVLIIGNEARGISDKASMLCNFLWKLPMNGGAESLNAAVAAGIMMYDLTR